MEKQQRGIFAIEKDDRKEGEVEGSEEGSNRRDEIRVK